MSFLISNSLVLNKISNPARFAKTHRAAGRLRLAQPCDPSMTTSSAADRVCQSCPPQDVDVVTHHHQWIGFYGKIYRKSMGLFNDIWGFSTANRIPKKPIHRHEVIQEKCIGESTMKIWWFNQIVGKLVQKSGVGKCPNVSHHPTIGEISSPTDMCFGDVKQIPQKGTFSNP